MLRRLQGGDVAAAGDPLQLADGVIADLAAGDVDHPREGDGIAGVERQTQIGEDVLDLLAIVEADAAHQLVGDAAADEDVLESA